MPISIRRDIFSLVLSNSSSTMDACDALLAEIQDLLHVYQKDLSGVANEIRTLQVRREIVD